MEEPVANRVGPLETTWRSFLESVPPGVQAHVSDMVDESRTARGDTGPLARPNVALHCESCDGERLFRDTAVPALTLSSKHPTNHFLNYACRNCGQASKTFAVLLKADEAGSGGVAWKYGEYPRFDPHTHPRLLKILDEGAELFLQGRGAENAGFGIGAFTYYRRVIEDQYGRILDEIINVAQHVESPASQIEQLRAARRNWHSGDILDEVGDALPTTLLIRGHNPISLLHRAASEDMHALSDGECLELAHSVREVLNALAERVDFVMKRGDTLKEALSVLLKREP